MQYSARQSCGGWAMSPRGGFANSILQPEPMSNPVGIILSSTRFGQICQFNPTIPNLSLFEEFNNGI